jgi:serine protease Do
MLVIVSALVAAGALCVYASGGASHGTAWYAEGLTPVSSHPAVEAVSVRDATRYAKGMSEAFRDAAKKVMPAVVFITNRPVVAMNSGNSRSLEGEEESPFRGTPFGDLFNSDPRLRQLLRGFPNMEIPHQSVVALGSGVIVDPSGIVLTNNHVVAGGGQITIRLHDGREFKGIDIKTDPTSDLAILRIDGKGPFPAADLGESNDTEVGDWVLALGQPFGLEDTVTAGIISAKQRGLGAHGDYLQTDAAINPGNSGGPLVNLDGQVIGINTAIKSNNGGYQGVGFAIPIDTAKWVGGQLERFGTVHRAFLGVGIQAIDQSLADQFKVNVNGGVVVTQVRPDSPAAAAGVKLGDIILQFAGKPVSSPRELQAIVETTRIGATEPLSILRDGQKMTLNVKCHEMPEKYAESAGDFEGPQSNESKESANLEKLGVQVENLTPDIARQLRLKDDHGVVITEVRPGSPAEMAGLRSGMVIAMVNQRPVKTTGDLQKALGGQSLAKGVLLLVRSAEGSRFVAIRAE